MDLTTLMQELGRDVARISDPSFPRAVSPVVTLPDLRALAKSSANDDQFTMRRMRTAVLTIDLRRSISPGLEDKAGHKVQVYLAFLRAIVAASEQFGGQVCSVSGDRVLVLFDEEQCYRNAVYTAFLLNTVVEGILVPNFPHRVIRCGIGIDAGRVMFSTLPVPGGGDPDQPFNALVWLGKPTQRATRLSDAANRLLTGGDGVERVANLIYRFKEWAWRIADEYGLLLNRLGPMGQITVSDTAATGWRLTQGVRERQRVEPILVSERVLKGFREQAAGDPSLGGLWWHQRHMAIPYVHQPVYGVNAHFVPEGKR